MRLIDGDRLLKDVKRELRYAPTYIQAKVEQCIRTAPAIDPIINDLRNELCLKCGKYKDAHLGACDGCRWKNENGGKNG